MDIFPLVDEGGRLFSPLVQAAILAQYCRSAKSARELLTQVDEIKASAFQDKWVVGFGHNSVAEHAVIPVCFEGVSILASKFLERVQRAAAAEKSTRVLKFDRGSFVPDQAGWVFPHELRALAYEAYDLYDVLVEDVGNQMAASMPGASDLTVTRATLDVCRYLLPAGSATNLALVANVLDLSRLLGDLLASPNFEFLSIGRALFDAIKGLGGPLIRHTDPRRWEQDWDPTCSSFSLSGDSRGFTQPGVALLESPSPGQVARVFELAQATCGMPLEHFQRLMNCRPHKAELPKCFEAARFAFNVVMDYGAFRDLQRHRRCTQIAAPLTAQLGYVVPDPIRGTSAGDRFESLMKKFQAYQVGKRATWAGQYAIPLAFLHSTYFGMDARELYHIVELRTPKEGRHIAYRRIAWSMFEQARRAAPELMQWCRAVKPEQD